MPENSSNFRRQIHAALQAAVRDNLRVVHCHEDRPDQRRPAQ